MTIIAGVDRHRQMPDQSPNEFVIASSVRTKIVIQLAEGAASTDELLDGIPASGSAVYDAVSTLADQGLVSEREDAWELTAHGQLVTDSIEQWQSTEAFLGADPEYWKGHDASVIPKKFRRRLPEIGDYEVVRSDGAQVTRHHRAALRRMREADHCLIFSPFFSLEYQEAVQWGRELFEEKWVESDSAERYAVREHPDVFG